MHPKILIALGFICVTVSYPETGGIDCNSLVQGLTTEDCQYLKTLGFASQGCNSPGNNGHIWLGDDGLNSFTFQSPNSEVILVLWDQSNGYASSFIQTTQPAVTYSLPKGSNVTISMANGISGAWSGIYDRTTPLSWVGQIFNTWGEFTTGDWATVDISREVNMDGNPMTIKVDSGCEANNNQCAFVCRDSQSCGYNGTYDLVNCSNQPNANYGFRNGAVEGGCGGWSNGGHVDVWFL